MKKPQQKRGKIVDQPILKTPPKTTRKSKSFWEGISIFSIIGKIFVFYLLICLLPTLYWRFIRTADWSEYKGEWAIVTGSSYGIGSEFSLSLAKRGINVVIAARTLYKLQELKKEINQKYPEVKVKILLMDVLKDGWEKSLEEIQDINISILVNNVGGNTIGNGTLVFYHEYPYHEIEDLHKLNLFSMQRMIYELLPKMVFHKKGRIINISSMSVLFPYKLSVYPGDKAFMNIFSEQITEEYVKFGIRAEALVVGQVSTPALGYIEPDGFITCTPKDIAESTLNLWGWREVYSPYWAHALFAWFNQNNILKKIITHFAKGVLETNVVPRMEKSREIIGDIHKKGEIEL